MRKTTALLVLVILIELTSSLIPKGRSTPYISASQKIISPSPAKYILFRLNVTYPYEARVGEDFNIYLQLWQGKNTSVYVSTIQVWISGNLTEKLTENLIEGNTVQNRKNTETLVVDRNLTIEVRKLQRWSINVWYSVQDLDFGGTWTTGGNHLASVRVYPQTYEELTNQLSDLQNQVADMQNQLWGFVFITAYLTVALGIMLPIVQKRRNTVSNKANTSKE
ncbi:MAG: hypothetical protein OEY81_00165 [Candidatus Bathyarchaeota archaeon]|nr:hypothetical protein [Candidatus Bathyarchaeota archaeon]